MTNSIDAFDASDQPATSLPVPPYITNNSHSSIPQDFAYYPPRMLANTVTTAGALAAGFIIGNLPGLLATAAGLTVTHVASHLGRNHDMRERPQIATEVMFERFGEKIVHKLGKKTGPARVWRASEAELSQDKDSEQRALDSFTRGLRHSLPVKMVYTYPRILLAKLRDELDVQRSKIWGQGGVNFHEGVASQRLQRAGMITPNPRTQDHMAYARQARADKGLTI